MSEDVKAPPPARMPAKALWDRLQWKRMETRIAEILFLKSMNYRPVDDEGKDGQWLIDTAEDDPRWVRPDHVGDALEQAEAVTEASRLYLEEANAAESAAHAARRAFRMLPAAGG